MSNSTSGSTTPSAGGTSHPREIRLVSHSSLFYWWPVWVFGFIFSLWTLVENNRLAVLPSETLVIKRASANPGADGKTAHETIVYPIQGGKAADGHQLNKITHELKGAEREEAIKSLAPDNKPAEKDEVLKLTPRVSAKSWMGPTYLILLCLVVVITNVPLRGLWSLIAVIACVTGSLFISLFGWWDDIFAAFFGLHVFINMAGYLMIATIVFVTWALATFIFDKRSYIIFTPGQIKVCEQIGGREKVYDTTGMTVEKHRDDWFRHIFLGFGSGDMSVRTAGADRHEIVMPNVALIGFKIGPIEQLLRERQTVKLSDGNGN